MVNEQPENLPDLGSPEKEELEQLLFAMESSMIDQAGQKRLHEILKQSAEARQNYLRWQMVCAAMNLEAEYALPTQGEPAAGLLPAPETKPSPAIRETRSVDSRWQSGAFFWTTIAMALLISVTSITLTAIQWNRNSVATRQADSPAAQSQKVEQTAEGVAIVTKLVNVDWGEDQASYEAGDAIKTGVFSLEQGLAQIEFFSGATIIVEGPAELDLLSALTAKVIKGKLRANVPEVARGFTLTVDEIKVVDLGTEFGLSVQDGRTDVQVFDGLVEVHTDADDPSLKRMVHAGGGITRTADGVIRDSEVRPAEFVNLSELESRQDQQIQARAKKWNAWSQELRQDERVVAYYAFDQQGSWFRKLDCSAPNSSSSQDGAIIGARRVEGRWTTKGGLEFKRPGDRVRMSIPGEFGSLTFAAWIKIDSLDRMYNSLFLTDNYNQGEPHWQILDTGQLFFSVRWRPDDWVRGRSPEGPAHHPVISPPFWKPSLSGKWIHVATTFDVTSSVVTHYLNGESIHAEKIPASLMVTTTRIGESTMGNWSIPTKPDAKFAIRNLNGAMDELLIMKSALSASEIQSIFEVGKP